MKSTLFGVVFMGCLFIPQMLVAQSQFSKGWAGCLEAQQGLSTAFSSQPDLYIGMLTFSPQVTVVADHLRLGAVGGLAYTNKIVDGIAGPRIAWKLKTFQAGEFGTLGNLQLQLEWLWGGSGHRMAGGGPKVEVGRRLLIGLTAHRDYGVNTWLFQAGVGYNLLAKKRSSTNHDPFHP